MTATVSTAEEFLLTQPNRRAEPILLGFHRWLANKPVALSGLRPEEVNNFFLQPFRKLVSPRTARAYARLLIGYLTWLHARGYLGFHPRDLGTRYKKPLPQSAADFLRTLEPTLRLGTRRRYSANLGHFHEWLDEAHLSLKRLTRPQVEQWLLWLHDEGLHPSTRIHAIHHVRAYLRWLFDRAALNRPPDELIRRRDLPKLPQYLPRPLAPSVDVELQSRLRQSTRPLWIGLMLMRDTGLRVGELRTLEYGCVRTDSHDNLFLKVPLGKLNNERLVPITQATAKLVERLQLVGPKPREFLLERAQGGLHPYGEYSAALGEAAEGLSDGAPITTHRLRHTYATSMLNAGMSLVGVMKLLGHRDYRMTLRYTAITQETVGKEYFAALAELQNRYAAALRPEPDTRFDPLRSMLDVAAWLKNHVGQELGEAQQAAILTKRLLRLRDAIAEYSR